MKELMEGLRYAKCLLIAQNCRDTAERVQAAITALETMPQWVKCSDRLPENDCDVLVTFDDDLVMQADFFKLQETFCELYEGKLVVIDDVSYWMHTPQPPKPHCNKEQI